MASASESTRPDAGDNYVSEEQRRITEKKHAAITRQKQSLNLQRELILSQRTSNPGRRQALESALKQIEAQLEALN